MSLPNDPIVAAREAADRRLMAVHHETTADAARLAEYRARVARAEVALANAREDLARERVRIEAAADRTDFVEW